ncbi:MAG: RagB/SusD family nutrient uptake outer membrane protein [Marinifilaceae bacterium]
MKIRNIIQHTIVALLCLSWSSCNSWLDVELVNRVEESELFSRASGFYKALAGVYADLSSSTLYGYELSYGSLDVMGQLYDYSRLPVEFTETKDLNFLNQSFRNNVVDAWWKRIYYNIESLNNILLWSEKNASLLTTEELHLIRGEALGLRSYLFFDLIRLFAPDVKNDGNAKRVPYNIKFGVTLPDLYTTSETLDLILKDLLEAEEYLKNDPIIGQNIATMKDESAPFRNLADKYVARINYYGVKAIMARIYLAKGDNYNARIKAQEVIDSKCFAIFDRTKLAQQSNNDLKDMLLSDEHIFSLRNKGISEKAYSMLLKESDNTRDVPLPFTITYATNYDLPSTDIRWMEWFTVGNLSTRMKKYYASKDNSKNYFSKIPLIRLSEMYMILAETYLNGDTEKGKEYLSIIRKARIGDSAETPIFSVSEYIKEMRREFPGEGQLFFMYKRLNHDILRDGVATAIPASNQTFVLPIPLSEIENGNIQQ